MANKNQTNEAIQKLAEGSCDSYQAILEHTIGLQERNVHFAQQMVDSVIKELRYQTESNQTFTSELMERAQKQRGDFQTLVGESVEAYTDLLYVPYAYYKETLEAAGTALR